MTSNLANSSTILPESFGDLGLGLTQDEFDELFNEQYELIFHSERLRTQAQLTFGFLETYLLARLSMHWIHCRGEGAKTKALNGTATPVNLEQVISNLKNWSFEICRGSGEWSDFWEEKTEKEIEDISVAADIGLWFSDLDVSNRCLLYTSPSPRDRQKSRIPSSA